MDKMMVKIREIHLNRDMIITTDWKRGNISSKDNRFD